MPLEVARNASLNWNIEHNGDRGEMKAPRDLNQSPSMLAFQVSRVNDSRPSQGEPLLDNEVQQVKRMTGHALIGRIVEHEGPTLVRRYNLSLREVFCRPGGLAACGGSAEDYE